MRPQAPLSLPTGVALFVREALGHVDVDRHVVLDGHRQQRGPLEVQYTHLYTHPRSFGSRSAQSSVRCDLRWRSVGRTQERACRSCSTPVRIRPTRMTEPAEVFRYHIRHRA